MARGAVNYLTSQAANRIAGVDTTFSWKDMAVSTAAAMLTKSTGNRTIDAITGASVGDGFLGDLQRNFVGGAVRSTLSRLAGRGGKQDWAQIAVDSFGNALASSVVREFNYKANYSMLRDAGANKDEAKYLASGKNAMYNVFSKTDISKERILELYRAERDGKLVLPVVKTVPGGELDNGLAGYSAADNTIMINEKFAEATQSQGPLGSLNSAAMMHALDEEKGHFYDNWLRGGKGDTEGDEGAMYAFESAKLRLDSDSDKLYTKSISINGNDTIDLKTSRADYGITAVTFADPRRIAADEKIKDKNGNTIELYGPTGHFFETAEIGGQILTEDRDRALRIAFWSQVPDMVPDLDAINNATSLGLHLDEESFDRVKEMQYAFHGLRGGLDLDAEREKTRDIIKNALAQNSAEGDVQAGLGIHRLGDLYAHTDVFGKSFPSIIGHLFYGHTPDEMTRRKDLNAQYTKDLAETMGLGLGQLTNTTSAENVAKVTSWTTGWNTMVKNSANEKALAQGTSDRFFDMYKSRTFADDLPSAPEGGNYPLEKTRYSPYPTFGGFQYVNGKMNSQVGLKGTDFNAFSRGFDAYAHHFGL
jgi:hypothetical protein